MDPEFSLHYTPEHDFQFDHGIGAGYDFNGTPSPEDLEFPDFGEFSPGGVDIEELGFADFDLDGYFQSSTVDDGCSCCTRSLAEGAGGAALNSTNPTGTNEGVTPSSPHPGNLSPTRTDVATAADDISSPSIRADLPVVPEAPLASPRLRHGKGKGCVKKRRKPRPSKTATVFQQFGSVHVRAEAIFLQFEDGQEQCSWRRHLGWRNSAGQLYDNRVLLSLLSADPASFRIRVRPGGDGYPLDIACNSNGYFEGDGDWRGVRVSLEDVRKMVKNPQKGEFNGEFL